MKTAQRRNLRFFSVPEYRHNAVIQLVIVSGIGFVAMHFLRVILMAFAGNSPAEAVANTYPYVGMSGLEILKSRWWTIFLHGWSHLGFWEWASNMIWLYCFGSVVQMLVGYKQIIPMFCYSVVTGGLFFAGAQLIPGVSLPPGYLLMGAQAGIMGLAAAALTISPKYRVYLGENLGIPLLVLAIVFALLMVLNTGMHLPAVLLLAGGALSGFTYIRLLQSGYKPGEWVYSIFSNMERSFTPDEAAARARNSQKRNKVLNAKVHPRKDAAQQKIDEILDKILQKGRDSLTAEERELLKKLSDDIDA